MKKILCSLVVLTVLSVLPANAQGVNFGLKAGINNTSMKFDKSVFDSENRFGWFFGPTMKVALPVTGLAVDVAALYEQKDAKVNGETINHKSIVLPVNARYSFGVAQTASVYVAAGPQVGFNVGSENFNWKEKDSYDNTFQLKKSEFSVNLGAGVCVGEHVELGLSFYVEEENPFTYNVRICKDDGTECCRSKIIFR